jgi:hypothetical protein
MVCAKQPALVVAPRLDLKYKSQHPVAGCSTTVVMGSIAVNATTDRP